MATLLEGYNLRYESTNLKSRATAAVAKKAIDILDDAATETAQRIAWAHTALRDAKSMADQMMWSVIADSDIISNGESATDAQVLSAVAGAIDTHAATVP
jgi:hypothetical protein